MHNTWKSSVSKMHVSANGSGSSMYISVNLLGLFFPFLLAMQPSRKKRRKMTRREEWSKLDEKEGGDMTLAA